MYRKILQNKYIRLTGLAMVCLLIGYLGGRYAAPVRTVTVDKIVTVDRVVTVDKVVTKVEQVKTADVQHDVKYVRVRERRPDGTITDTTTTTDLTKEKTGQAFTKSTDAIKVVEHTVYVDKLSTKLIERTGPKWSVMFMPGYDLVLHKTVFGASIDHALVGPVSVGLWGNSSLAGGITVGVRF